MQTDRQRAARSEEEHRPLRQRAEAGDRGALDGLRGSRGAERARRRAPSTSRCPDARRALGHRHPLTVVRDRMEEIFTRMGFAIVEGPEVEDEWHCFDALNMPAEHPARDMQDTLYLATPIAGRLGRRTTCGRCCARTPRRCRSATCRRTSRRSASSCPAASIAATISTSRTRRRSARSKGWSVGEGISLADLKGTLLAFAREMFSPTIARAVPPELLPVHRAERRNRHQLLAVRRRRLRDVQEDRLDRARRLRHGAPGGVRSGRLRRRSGTPASRGASASSASRSCAIRWRTSGCSTRTTCGFSNSSRTDARRRSRTHDARTVRDLRVFVIQR